MDVLVRQAHPGPDAPAYHRLEQKLRDGRRYQREEQIPWPVVVDDLTGTTHQVYGGLAAPTYLIDSDGRVAFYNLWTHVPTLHEAIDALLQQGGRGVVKGGVDRLPHPLASVTDGWRALRRGRPQSVIDLEMAAPGIASGIWLSAQLRPVLAPLTLRAAPLPVSVKIGLATGAATILILGARRLARAGKRGSQP